MLFGKYPLTSSEILHWLLLKHGVLLETLGMGFYVTKDLSAQARLSFGNCQFPHPSVHFLGRKCLLQNVRTSLCLTA